jgi:hypothetical protein
LCIASKVVAGQIEKECITREPTIKRYLALVTRMGSYFKGFTVEYIEKTKNAEVDELARAVGRNTPLPADVFFQVISYASDSCGGAQSDQFDTGRRLTRTNNGVPLPLLPAR